MLLLLLQLFPLFCAGWLVLRRRSPGPNPLAWGMGCSFIPWLLVGLLAFPLWESPGNPISPQLQWHLAWINDAGINLRFSADGLSLLFLALTAIVTTFVLATARTTGPNHCGFVCLVLFLESMLFGVFTARHFIPWFLCWEMTLIPAYLLVRLWGGPGASQAAFRFFAITLGGSICMLAGFLVLQWTTGTMDFDTLSRLAREGKLAARVNASLHLPGVAPAHSFTLLAGFVFLGLAVKLPVLPFHAWLPDTYVEAPTPVSMLLTGVVSKMAVQGLLVVFFPVFREAMPALSPWLFALALLTIVPSVFAALAQEDTKRMLAYSSINHLGYCLLAVAAAASAGVSEITRTAAFAGVVFQGVTHGIIASTLFCCAGLLEHRAGSRLAADFGGVRQRMPALAGFTGLAAFASLGLPGLGGFVGEFLVFRAAFAASPWLTGCAASALFVTAIFLLRWQRRVFHGPISPGAVDWKDLTKHEILMLSVAALLIILPGIWPQSILHWLQGVPLFPATPPFHP